MPKAVYNNWIGGLAPYSDGGNARLGTSGSLRELRDIDVHDSPGFLSAGLDPTNIDSGTVLDNYLIDAVIDTQSQNAWAVDASGAVYKLSGAIYTTIAQTFTAATVGSTRGEACVIYTVNGTDYLFYFYEDDAGQLNLSTEAGDHDWLSTVPSGAASLTDAPHPVIEGEDGKLYIGNGKDLARLDGTSGANGTFTTSALDLPAGWEITSLSKVRNLLAVCATKKVNPGRGYRTVSGIFYWNYVDSSFTVFVPVEDNRIVSSITWNESLYILTTGRTGEAILRRVSTEGAQFVTRFIIDIDGTDHQFNVGGTVGSNINVRNVMEVVDNRLIVGLSDGGRFNNYLFAYGAKDAMFPPVLSPIGSAETGDENTAVFSLVKNLFSDIVYASYTDGTSDFYVRFASPSSNAKAKGLYQEVDLNEGRNMRVNWIRVYFMPLVENDDLTVSLETNYGTSNTLQGGNITFSSDGAITEKELIPAGPLECHAFSPVITWNGGDAKPARIVVDYDILE